MNIISMAAAVTGTRAKLAELLGVSPAAVTQWGRRKKIPLRHVLKIEQITGISRHVLRPDVFGPNSLG